MNSPQSTRRAQRNGIECGSREASCPENQLASASPASSAVKELWLTAEQIAGVEAISSRGVRKRLAAVLADSNGTRSLYERRIKSTRGGGAGGGRPLYNVALLARDFPQALTAATLEKLFATASASEPSGDLFHPSPDRPITPSPDSYEVVTLPKGALVVREKSTVIAMQPTLPLFTPQADAAITTLPESSRPWAAARAEILAPLEGSTWRRWEGQLVCGIRIEKKDDLVRGLARESEAAHRGGVTVSGLVAWRQIEERLRHAAGDPQAALLPVGARTLYHWLSWHAHGRSDCAQCRRRFCSEPAAHRPRFNYAPGPGALGDPPRVDAGQSRYFESHPRAAAFLLAKRNENLTTAHAYERLREEWAAIGETGAPPSYSTARAFLERAVPAPFDDLARLGSKRFADRHLPALRRTRPGAMDCWVLDHRRHDVFCWLSMFPEKPAGALWRLWLTAIYDWGSGAMVGWCFAPEPSSNTINSALRMAAAEHGFPRELYWDRGRDFQRVQRILESEEQLAGLLRGHGVEITRALPYNAKAKPIESWFNAWSSRFDRSFGPAWAGNRPSNCLPACREAQKQHEQWLRQKREATPLPSDAEFILEACAFIAEWNAAAAPHLTRRPGGVPQSRAQLLALESGRAPAAPRTLDALFFKREKRTLEAGGCVTFKRGEIVLRYEPLPEHLGPLGLLSGSEAVVARDPYDFSSALAFDPRSNEFLGELRIQPLAVQGQGGRISEALIKENQRRRAQLRKMGAAYMDWVAGLAAGFGIRSERQYRQDRLLATGTDLATAAPGSAALALNRDGAGPAAREKKELASPFVSDAVRASDFWKKGDGECD